MLGPQYEQALTGERCWIRHDDGERALLPVQRWLGHGECDTDSSFDDAVLSLCSGPTLDLGCGPGRLVARLIARGVFAAGVDQSAAAVRLALHRGALVMLGDIFDPLPGLGAWHTVLLVDGNVGLGGDPVRVLQRAAQLLAGNGHCLVEFDPNLRGVHRRRIRLETDSGPGPWFRWASAGLDSAADLAQQAGLQVTEIRRIGTRAITQMAKTQ